MPRSAAKPSRVGDYRLDAVIGRGGSSTVWRGRRRGSVHQAVAVKVVSVEADTAARARLRAEAEVLASLDHPHIVRILDIVDDGDGLAIVMQLAPGGSVADLLEHRGPLAAGELVALAAPVASALGSAHRRGLVHGDVKPANILLSSDGEPLLADFGMAHLVAGAAPGGTDAYLAPEVKAGSPPGHPAVDVWALGVTCIEALTGRAPSASPRVDDLVELRPDLPDALVEVLERMLTEAADRRPTDADQLAVALRAAVPAADLRRPEPLPPEALEGARARPPTRAFGAEPPRRPERRVPWTSVAKLAAVVVWLGVLAWFLWPESDGCPTADVDLGDRGAQVQQGDLDGEGCLSTVAFGVDPDLDAMVLEVWDPEGTLAQRFTVGREGDQMLLGDWDCDGHDTAALYRPSDGTVLLFDRWPSGDDVLTPLEQPGLAAGGRAVVESGGDGCDVVAVRDGLDV